MPSERGNGADDLEDLARAKMIDRLVLEIHRTLNHSGQFKGASTHKQVMILRARDTAWLAHLHLERAISIGDKGDGDAIDEAYADNVPAELAYIRDNPGVTGKEATGVIAKASEARALIGSYPEGYERWRAEHGGR
jgi:hypothetical protein